ncbi:peptidyl-prolyl cis-trans isomerase [Anopheles sinensis]|uniref:Peptidyl-prolyl cis-trans isomerase n=1 Tax=Anopheles sinensis TaxID=74873 RepID=A0A084VTY4_ANOSI|nr:peptidyl-prolyl cis-trans isomerase [Anopheles sinensis]
MPPSFVAEWRSFVDLLHVPCHERRATPSAAAVRREIRSVADTLVLVLGPKQRLRWCISPLRLRIRVLAGPSSILSAKNPRNDRVRSPAKSRPVPPRGESAGNGNAIKKSISLDGSTTCKCGVHNRQKGLK